MQTNKLPSYYILLILPFTGEKEVEKLTRKKGSPPAREYAAMITNTGLAECGCPGSSPGPARETTTTTTTTNWPKHLTSPSQVELLSSNWKKDVYFQVYILHTASSNSFGYWFHLACCLSGENQSGALLPKFIVS